MCCHSDFYNISTHFRCSLCKVPVKNDFLDIYLTMFFGAGISGKISDMRVSFFKKNLKFNIDFKNAKKNSEKLFCYCDNCI